jgi:hypothetical protein
MRRESFAPHFYACFAHLRPRHPIHVGIAPSPIRLTRAAIFTIGIRRGTAFAPIRAHASSRHRSNRPIFRPRRFAYLFEVL